MPKDVGPQHYGVCRATEAPHSNELTHCCNRNIILWNLIGSLSPTPLYLVMDWINRYIISTTHGELPAPNWKHITTVIISSFCPGKFPSSMMIQLWRSVLRVTPQNQAEMKCWERDSRPTAKVDMVRLNPGKITVCRCRMCFSSFSFTKNNGNNTRYVKKVGRKKLGEGQSTSKKRVIQNQVSYYRFR